MITKTDISPKLRPDLVCYQLCGGEQKRVISQQYLTRMVEQHLFSTVIYLCNNANTGTLQKTF